MARLRIRAEAERQGYTGEALAHAARLNRSTISAIWSNPRYNIKFLTLEKIAQTLGVRVTDLIVDDSPTDTKRE